MGQIQILDNTTANQIAAGEVIERPYSVVKELLENSLDAGATQVDIQIEEGGTKRIVVSDNGKGMAADDAVLCFSRYATSKLKNASELHSINSFGFRGEALASIASVSKVRLSTRQAESELGNLVIVEGGNVVLVEEVGCPVGTRIEVENLFYNVPARLKFLKTTRSEASAVENIVRMASLAKTHVGFELRVNNAVKFSVQDAPVDADLENPRCLERAITTLGEECRTYLYPFRAETDLLKLSGYVAAPLVTRKDSRGIRLYVNQRPVEDKQLIQAVRVAYRSLLEIGRHPICSLNLEIDTNLVDVNVHPRKTEVRFSETSRVQSHLIRLLSDFLAGTPWFKKTIEQNESFASMPEAKSPPAYFNQLIAKPLLVSADETRESTVQSSAIKQINSYPSLDGHLEYAELRVVGQIDATFILLEGTRSMIILDQHAAHERVVFQRLQDQVKEKGIKSQPLLFPVQIPLTHEQAGALAEHAEKLTHYGFDVSVFGDNQGLVKSIPADFRATSAQEVIQDVLDDIAQHQRTDALDEITDHVCAQIACHSSIRAGQSLKHEEISALLMDLDKTEYGAHCPHGRPVMRAIPFGEMAKWFHRS